MNTITDIFRTYGPEYIDRFGNSMPDNHQKVIEAITNCRTANYGLAVYECEDCHDQHWLFQSCGNRHCPACQNHKTRQWLQRQLKRQLPGHHFMITFTVPKQLRPFIRSRQKVAYAALFKASAAALKKLAADRKYIGGDLPGFFGVLHTWGRTLAYHPHIHYVVAGGAITKKDGRWQSAGSSFYVPIKALSRIYRAKFKNELRKAGLLHNIPAEVWKIDWIVNSQAVGASEQSIGYLAPYVFKVAITNSRIIEVENRQVTFRYKKGKSARWRKMTLQVMEFIRRFLQHVLPNGFMKIRYFGFFHHGSSFALEKVQTLIELSFGFEIEATETMVIPLARPVCPACGGKLKYLYSILPQQMIMGFDTG